MDVLYIPQLDELCTGCKPLCGAKSLECCDAGESPTAGRYRLLKRVPEEGSELTQRGSFAALVFHAQRKEQPAN